MALYLVKLACELPEDSGNPLSLWTCAELARALRDNGVVQSISPQSVQRMLQAHQLKPWRVHHWLGSKVPRDDTRTGEVIGLCRRRKRQVEFIELLEEIDRTTPASVTHLHVVCDNVSTHHGKKVCAWLAAHPRFHLHFTPVHCSWMNQVEQWFSILQRKRLVAPNFDDLAELEVQLLAFIAHWNQEAHPFNWTAASFEKVLAKVDAALRTTAPTAADDSPKGGRGRGTRRSAPTRRVER